MTGRNENYHAALASTSRRRVLEILRASPEPLSATAIAVQMGLHVTTARFHLDQLATAGLAYRRAGAEQRRGRPRMLYGPAGAARDDDVRGQLIQVLATALAREEDATADSIRAGRQWAGTFAPADPVDPMPDLVEILERLGFGPEPDSTVIQLRSCPFRDVARKHPEVICAVHRGLIEQFLDGTRMQAQLNPFVEPTLCVVALEAAL